MKFPILKFPMLVGLSLSASVYAQQEAGPSAAQPTTASVTESANQEQQQPSGKRKKAAAVRNQNQKQRPKDRGLTEDEESALPIKSKFRYGNEDIEVDPD